MGKKAVNQETGLASFWGSLLQKCGISSVNTSSEIDDLLSDNYANIIVLVCKGCRIDTPDNYITIVNDFKFDEVYIKSIIKDINEKGNYKAYGFFSDEVDIKSRITNICKGYDTKIVFGYCDDISYINDFVSKIDDSIIFIVSNDALSLVWMKNKGAGRIRQAKADDYDFVRKALIDVQKNREKVRKDLFYNKDIISKTDFLNLCQRTSSDCCFVYEENNEVLGFAIAGLERIRRSTMVKEQSVMMIRCVFVRKDRRRLGIGTKLIRKVFEHARKLHLKKVYVMSWYFEDEWLKFIGNLDNLELCSFFEIDNG